MDFTHYETVRPGRTDLVDCAMVGVPGETPLGVIVDAATYRVSFAGRSFDVLEPAALDGGGGALAWDVAAGHVVRLFIDPR